MANELSIKRNDTKPSVQAEVQDSNGSALDLGAGSYVYFNMATNDNTYTPVLSGLGTITDANNGLVQYDWAVGDTGSVGTFLGEFEVTYNDGARLTVPSNHSFVINIYEDYDGN